MIKIAIFLFAVTRYPKEWPEFSLCSNGNHFVENYVSLGAPWFQSHLRFIVVFTSIVVYRELWTGIPGIAVADLVSNVRFPCHPTESKFIDTFCIYHTQNRNHYGQRLRSFFRAPESGNYQFQTSCNYACQLWMSNDEQASRKRLIVNQKKITDKFLFDR